MTEPREERCCLCDDATGKVRKSDNSIYMTIGPLCKECIDDLTAYRATDPLLKEMAIALNKTNLKMYRALGTSVEGRIRFGLNMLLLTEYGQKGGKL